VDDQTFGAEVARFQLPMPVRGLDQLVDYLKDAYGSDLMMYQDEHWMIVTRPAPR
jgi:hypothetical protein